MSDPLASDANVLAAVDKVRYLKVTKDGIPINKQVPRSKQVISGITGGTFDYDGSDDLVIFATSLTATLFIRISQNIQRMRSLLRRAVQIHVIGPSSQEIVLLTGTTVMMVTGTPGSSNSYIIPASALHKLVSLYFTNENVITLDGGTWGAINLLGVPPKTYDFAIEYAYTDITICTVGSIFIPDNSTYDVQFMDVEPKEEGTITPLSSSVTGPGTGFVAFRWIPASRLTRAVEVITNFTKPGTGEYVATARTRLKPDLSNVFGSLEFVTGPVAASRVAMYNTVVNAGDTRMTAPGSAIPFTFPQTLLKFTVNVQDNLFIFTYAATPNIVRWIHASYGNIGTICDVSTLNAVDWNAGATIADIDYCETNSTLYILPGNASQRMAMIPLKRYDVNRSNELLTGPLKSVNGFGVATTVFYSIAVDPNTLDVYIANRPNASNIFVTAFAVGSTVAATLQTLNTLYATGSMSLAFTNRGQLVAQASTDLILRRARQGMGISAGLINVTGTYALPVYLDSMSRNLYGFFPQ